MRASSVLRAKPGTSLLLGFPFLAGGCAAISLALWTVAANLQARSWVETPARIVGLSLEAGDEATHRVLCTYEYTIGGRTYQNSRVGLIGGSDGIGSWQRQTYERLDGPADRRTTCFVNAADPQQSVLDRNVRFPLLCFLTAVGLAFASAGLLLVARGIQHRRMLHEQIRGRNGHPDEPWLWRSDWAQGIVRSTLPDRSRSSSIVAALWVICTLPVLCYLPREWQEHHEPRAFLGLLLPGIALALCAYAGRLLLQARRFGESYLALTTLPGATGRELAGNFVLAGDAGGMNEVNLRLECTSEVTRFERDQSCTNRNSLWSFTKTLPVRREIFARSELRLPFTFCLPGNRPATDHLSPLSTVTWTITATASMKGVDLKLDFEVPVFRTPRSPDLLAAVPQLTPDEQTVVDAWQTPAGIEEEQVPGGARFTVSCWPGAGTFCCFTCFALVLTTATAFLLDSFLRGAWFPALFIIVFAPVSLLFWLILSTFIGGWRLTVRPEALERERSCGPLRWRRTVTAEQMCDLSATCLVSNGRRKWYAINARTRQSRSVTLISMTQSEPAARWLVRRIEDVLTLADSPAASR